MLGGGQGKGERLQRRERERRETRARAQGLCLLRCCLPCSFPRSSINETRVQSRRMSNKYVSCSPPPPSPLPLLPPPTRHRPPLPSPRSFLPRARFPCTTLVSLLAALLPGSSSSSFRFKPSARSPVPRFNPSHVLNPSRL